MDRKIKKFFLVAVPSLLLVLGVWNIANHLHGGSTTPSQATPTTSLPPPASSTGSPEVIKPDSPSHNNPDEQGAIRAAGLAYNLLNQAQLLPQAQLEQVVNEWVVPEKRTMYLQAFSKGGQTLAQAWGYQSVDEAHQRANFYASPLKYHVESFKSGQAIISLFGLTSFIANNNATNQLYQVPDISTYEMRWLGGKWLYVGTRRPEPGVGRPIPLKNLSVQEAVQQYQSYLKEYRAYVG